MFEHFLDDVGDDRDLFVVYLNRLRQFLELRDQIDGIGQQFAQPDESPHDFDVDRNGGRRVQDTGKHRHAEFGETRGGLRRPP